MKKIISITIIFALFSLNISGQWTYVSSPGFLGGGNNLTLFGNDTLYIIADSFFKKSFDGGDTWQIIQTPNPGVNNNSVYELDFCDKSNGIINSYEGLYKTNNGGSTWQLISTDFLRKIKCVSPSVFFANKSNSPANSEIIKSVDGGNSWSTIFNYSTTLVWNPIQVFSELSLYTFSNGHLYKTFDGGSTWDSVQVDINNVSDLEFTSINVGHYSSGTKLYRTQNGGYNWDSIQFPDLIMDLNFVDDYRGAAACTTFVGDSNSIIARTLDGGVTWNFDQINGFGNLWLEGVCSVDLYDINYGFASGCFERVFKLDAPLNTREFNEDPLFLYPNPVENKLFVGVQNQQGQGNIKILNMQGKIIYNKSFSKIQNLMIDTYNFSEGIYIIQVISEMGAFTKQFIKK